MKKTQASRIGIVGNGRLAKHFKFYFSELNLPTQSWDRHSNRSLQHFLSAVDIVLLMISDDSIEPFVKEHSSSLEHKTLFHFSGALSFPHINCCHPLMTFSDHLLSVDKYQQISFIGERGKINLVDCIPRLKNPIISLEASEKGKYHAWCVMAGNFTTILWQECFKTMSEELGISADHLTPYMDQIISNLKHDAKSALSGPLARKDKSTIRKNIESVPHVYQELYRAFLAIKGIEMESTDENSI